MERRCAALPGRCGAQKILLAGCAEIFGEYREATSEVRRKTESVIDPNPMLDWPKLSREKLSQ
jgi:hypothetical protein